MAIVSGSIVDNDELPVLKSLPNDTCKGLAEDIRLIVQGYDDRHPRPFLWHGVLYAGAFLPCTARQSQRI